VVEVPAPCGPGSLDGSPESSEPTGGGSTTTSTTVQRGNGVEHTIPNDRPASLSDPLGPKSGSVRVRPRIDTSPDPVYDRADAGQRWSPYSAVVRDGLARSTGPAAGSRSSGLTP